MPLEFNTRRACCGCVIGVTDSGSPSGSVSLASTLSIVAWLGLTSTESSAGVGA